jgi:pyruvate/2-oxoglutarate dehydrogenase complex dihydrolipoamide dehydrogenase (E3) component
MTTDLIVTGAGPAGVVAARRAAELGAGQLLLIRGEFGCHGTNDEPVPVRTLAHEPAEGGSLRKVDLKLTNL